MKILLRFIRRLLHRSRPIRLFVSHVRDMSEDDLNFHREFVLSPECKSVEKALIIRIGERMDVALDMNASELGRRMALERIDELKDILREWDNIRVEMAEEQKEKADKEGTQDIFDRRKASIFSS